MKTKLFKSNRLGIRIDTVTSQRIVFYFGFFAVRFETFFDLAQSMWIEKNLFLTF